jgi:hypothetical protein
VKKALSECFTDQGAMRDIQQHLKSEKFINLQMRATGNTTSQ